MAVTLMINFLFFAGSGSRYLIKLMASDGSTLGPPGATYVTTDRGRR